MKRPTPTQSESPFGFDEFFFSTTDKRGVIRYGNDVFVRVSVYPKETMLGAPHSLIRHPDMPRAVFKEFWNFLNQGKAVGAYVKNLAGNGSYYWVYAFAFPIGDGYLSVRFKPSSELFSVVQGLYADVLAFEQQEHSLEESHQYLLAKIQKAGFTDYENFMMKAVMEELKSRAAQVLESETRSSSAHGAGQITAVTSSATRKLNDVFDKLRDFQGANQSLDGAMGRLDQGFQQLKFISINMKIAAAKFGEMAASLGVVSHEFSVLSGTIEKHLGGLAGFVQELSGVIQKCVLRAAALNVQMLMVDFFVRESIAKLASSENAFDEMLQNQKAFSDLFAQYCQNLDKEFSELKKSLSAISFEMLEVAKFVTGLEVVRQMGAIESARTTEIKNSFTHYLEAMDDFIQLLRESTGEIGRGVTSLTSNSEFIVSSIRNISGNVDQIFALASSSQEQQKAG
ncbi:PAS domain-containing protein [Bdellovibrio bacteriovorus]|uniref:Putative sensory protein n=1 Tax=Bdellovibrio bacteriovorus str. Tiberius TaxID=1069642 RepID=K7ZF01_BDEBC|nr:PAS domain-containing protein [Bdellovibrio bacteriovorus]AFY00997.1 putative sensory protein [Bdellovibrio bacteriovorus str. Tiberius]